MDVRIINPFIVSAVSIFREMANLELEKGKPESVGGRKLISGYGVVIGMVGGVNGQVFYEFPLAFARSVTEILNGKKRVDYETDADFNDILESTLNELGNIISGKAVTILSSENIDVDITPPSIIRGTDVQVISKNMTTITVPFQSNIGYITVNVAFAQS